MKAFLTAVIFGVFGVSAAMAHGKAPLVNTNDPDAMMAAYGQVCPPGATSDSFEDCPALYTVRVHWIAPSPQAVGNPLLVGIPENGLGQYIEGTWGGLVDEGSQLPPAANQQSRNGLSGGLSEELCPPGSVSSGGLGCFTGLSDPLASMLNQMTADVTSRTFATLVAKKMEDMENSACPFGPVLIGDEACPALGFGKIKDQIGLLRDGPKTDAMEWVAREEAYHALQGLVNQYDDRVPYRLDPLEAAANLDLGMLALRNELDARAKVIATANAAVTSAN